MKFLTKFLATLLTIIIIFALAYVGLAYYLGIKAEESINNEVAVLSDSKLFKVDDYHYDRGWFKSKAVAKVSIKNNVLETINIDKFPEVLKKVLTHPVTFNTTVKHGPFVNKLFLRAYAITDVIFEKEAEKEIIKFFSVRNPFKIEDMIQLNGAGTLDFTLNPMKYEELSGIQIKFDGLKGQLDYNRNYREYAWNVNAPKFYMKLADKGGAILSGLTYKSTNYPNKGSIDTGLIELAFDKLAVSAKLEDKVNFNLSDILGTSLNIKLNKIFDPKLSFEVSDLQINQFLLRTDVTQKDDLVRMEGALSLDSFNLNNDIYGPLIFKMSADHIHGKLLKLLKDYLADLTKQELTVDEWQDKLLAYIRGPAAGLFTDNPEFNIKQIYLRMPDGEVKVSGSMKFEGLDVNDLSDFSALINKSKASFDYSLPEILAINVFENQVIGLLITDQEVISEQDMKNVLETTKYLVKGFINSYASMNYINFANGIISGSIRLEQGKMYLNGVEYQKNQTDIDSIYSEEDDRLLRPEVPAFEDDYPEDESISSPEPQNNNRNNNRVQTQEDGSSSNLDAIF
ncbi:DUF945 family protein [Neisseriaceae bacterium PsAf]|nr:DUF945 family protein [Neisseriaceae bacterium PsAf]